MDVALQSEQLVNLGFRVTSCTNLTQREMEDALEAFSARLSRRTVSYFAFAGHGAEESGKNALYATDGDDKVGPRWVDLDWVVRELSSRNTSGTGIFVIDACRTSRKNSVFIAPQRIPQGSLIAFSTSPGRSASDGVPGKGSPFARAMSRMLVEMTLEKDIEVAYRDVVADTLESTNQRQRPWLLASIPTRGILSLALPGPTSAPVSAQAPVLVSVGPAPQPSREEQQPSSPHVSDVTPAAP